MGKVDNKANLFCIKITANVTKSLHQDFGPCYLHLPIFSFTYTFLSVLQNKKLLLSLFSSAN